MDNRTPPATIRIDDYDHLLCPGGSASTDGSVDYRDPQDWSPETALTTASTPPERSPRIIRECGPLLLPRVRPQDQLMGPAVHHGHSRTISLPTTGFPMQFGGHLPVRSSMDGRSISQGPTREPSPARAPSPFQHMVNDQASSHSRRPSFANSRSLSTSNVRSHSRNVSSSSIDAATVHRYAYPTYRSSPTPQPVCASTMAPVSRNLSALNHFASIAMPHGQMQSYPSRHRTTSPPAPSSRLSVEVGYDPVLDTQTSTCMEYLTKPNPIPQLVQRSAAETQSGPRLHFWWDVRNVLPWSDFNINTISAIPELQQLLRVPVPLRDLPAPARVNTNPETSSQLVDLCAFHYAVKVNAALRITQGSETHIAMRRLQTGARAQPEFIASYQSDQEKTIAGDGRGRVIGIVKCYDQWNSGMRNGLQPEKVKYLAGLAHLQHFMREHNTRYGFLLTEIELVCVRAGGAPSLTSNVPLFGHLEIAASVQISAAGPDPATGNVVLTAGLALWWLHMLAKEHPIPGQYHWRMDVGGPAALSRRHHLEKDGWIPPPLKKDQRDAKVCRGWFMPNEPLSKREMGKGRGLKR